MASAVAVTPDRNVESSYHAPPGCPTQGDYVQYVESRSLKLRLFAEPAAVETNERVRVRIQPDTDTAGWHGALVIEGPTPLEREVRGERCEDVVLALALITVLRLEPNRESEAPGAAPPGTAALATGGSGTAAAATTAATATSPTSAAPSPAPSEPAAAPSAAAAAAAASVSPAGPAEPAASALTPAETLPVAEPAPSAAAEGAAAEAAGPDAVGAGAAGSTVAATAGAAASAASEAAPGETQFARDAAGAPVGASDSGPSAPANTSPFLVEPALAAYAGYASAPSHAFQAVLRGEARFHPGRQAWAAAASLSYGHSSQQNPAVDLGFDSLLAGLALCPPGLTLSFGIWLEACAEARGGVLAVSVTERELPLDVDSAPRPWFDVGPSLQVGLPLSSRWTLRALSSVTLVLMRDSFDVQRVVVDEDGEEQPGGVFTLYSPPAVSFQLLLGIGYQL